MSNTSWKPEWLESQSPQDDSPWPQGAKALALTLYHRVRRGGVGLLLRVLGVSLGFLLFYQLVPAHVPDRYRNVLSWSTPETVKGGGLRIVTFGSQDLMGSAIDTASNRLTWPEQLCQQLNCSSLLSFVPTSEYSPGLTSNEIYSKELLALQQIAKDTDVTENPASDYLFVNDQYPVPAQTPDLDTQIDQFLSLPTPETAPQDTLWIFSFGTWDIWKLAAMPLQSGEKVVDAMAAHIFDKVESLYRQSLSPGSIAFSNFWSNATEEEFHVLVDHNAASVVDQRRLESFRVLIPQLFDISLTPGWHNRAAPSIPHTSAEQVRNSALLTERWNSRIGAKMDDWNGKRQARPDGIDNEVAVKDVTAAPKAGAWADQPPSLLRLAKSDDEKVAGENVVYAPYPQRLGLHSKPADVILGTMMEEEMQKSGVSDTQGRGSMSKDDLLRFSDVWTPCIPSNPHKTEDAEESAECDVPDQHLFYTSFTVGQRAINELAKLTADAVLESLIAVL